jgi:hypothetical protein
MTVAKFLAGIFCLLASSPYSVFDVFALAETSSGMMAPGYQSAFDVVLICDIVRHLT